MYKNNENVWNKPMKVSEGFSVARYASNVANELLWALEGLIGNK